MLEQVFAHTNMLGCRCPSSHVPGTPDKNALASSVDVCTRFSAATHEEPVPLAVSISSAMDCQLAGVSLVLLQVSSSALQGVAALASSSACSYPPSTPHFCLSFSPHALPATPHNPPPALLTRGLPPPAFPPGVALPQFAFVMYRHWRHIDWLTYGHRVSGSLKEWSEGF